MEIIAQVIGWLLAIFIGGLELIMLWLIVSGRISLERLISEPSGDASMSRFEFLVFTFVIAMSLFLIVVSQSPPQFPEVPPGILGLLGISGGSYVISKGIQTSRDVGLKGIEAKTGEATPASGEGGSTPP